MPKKTASLTKMKKRPMHTFIIYALLFCLCACLPLQAAPKEDMPSEAGLWTGLDGAALTKRAETLAGNGEWEMAARCYTLAAERYATQDGGEAERARCLCRAGNIFYAQHGYAAAMDLYLQGLRVAERSGLEEMQAELYMKMGNIYSTFADYGRSVALYEKVLAIVERHGDNERRVAVLNNLIGALCLSGEVAEAKRYYVQLRESGTKVKSRRYDLLMSRGLIEANGGTRSEAAQCYRQAAACADSLRLGAGYVAAAYSCLAELYEQAGRKDSALWYLHRNERIARQENMSDLLVETLRSLARVYEKGGDKQKALGYKSQYVDLTDSLFNRNEFNRLKNAQFLYETDKNKAQIKELTEEKVHQAQTLSLQRRWLATVTVSLLLISLLFAVVYSQKRKLKAAYKDLYARNCEVLRGEQDYKRRLAELEKRVAAATAQEATDAPEANKAVEAEEAPSTQSATASGALQLTPAQREQLISGIRHVMEETQEYCSPDFSIERMATLIGSNSRYVSQIINEEYHKNFRSFLNDYRIKEAMLRLGDVEHYGHLTIKAISESVGYRSQTNFIAVFTKHTGIKPSMFQKLSKERSS